VTLAIDAYVATGGFVGGSSVPLPHLTTTNNVVIVVFIGNITGTLATISDSASLTWTLRANYVNGGTKINEYYAISASSLSSDTITITTTGGGVTSAVAIAISGANIASPYDVNVALPNTGYVDPGTVSTTAANTIVFGAFVVNTSNNITSGSGFTALDSEGYWLVEYQNFSSVQSGLSVPLEAAYVGYGLAYICDAIQAASATFTWQSLNQGTRDYVWGKAEIIGY